MTGLITSRRSFFMGLGAALAAPAIVPYANLMPVRAIFTPGYYILADGIPNGAYADQVTGVIFPFIKPPRGVWLPLDGGMHRVADYPDLAKFIGGAFGGDGVHTFAVPNAAKHAEFGDNLVSESTRRFDA